MRVPIVLVAGLVACAPEAELGTTSGATTCGSIRTELTPSAAPRYKPVGFLNNGCTAFLLDREHIAAAAHCFVRGDGSFQTDLRFYPGFHPDLVANDPNAVPHGRVERVVVGTRVSSQREPLHPNSDWGIAKIASWEHLDPSSLTDFAKLDGLLQEGPGPVEHVAYNRAVFPMNGPDMTYDTTFCRLEPWGAGAPQTGLWTTVMQPAPAGETPWCNSRWMAGNIFSGCELVETRDGVIHHDCEIYGGSSGAPLLRERKDGSTVVLGLTHGGAQPWQRIPSVISCRVPNDPVCGPAAFGYGCDPTAQRCYQDWMYGTNPAAPPTCTPRSEKLYGVGPAATRFAYAPRFASNVAIARRTDGSNATAVFGVDADLDQVVMRERIGDQPDYDEPFQYWRPLPRTSEHQLENIAACSDKTGRPMVFVTARQNNRARILRTRYDEQLGAWRTWEPTQVPGKGVPADLADVDAVYDNEGNCHVYALDAAGDAIWSANMNTDWVQPPNWQLVTRGSPITTGTKITALRDDDGFTWLVAIDDQGGLNALARECNDDVNAWFEYDAIPNQQAVGRWRDVDLYWNSVGEARLVALPESADVAPLVQFELPRRSCGARDNPDGSLARPADDVAIMAKLWVPDVKTSIRPTLRTITASRWLEDPPGTISPTIFATDDSGNVYFISNTKGYGWTFEWQSFYHERVMHP